MEHVLQIENLKTYFYTDAGVAHSVDGVSFSVPAGKTLALVGESGCGKSVTALSILRLVPQPPGRIVSGKILLNGEDLLALSESGIRAIRGNRISMIFQEPMTSLNPVFTVGAQVMAVLELHRSMSKEAARKRTVELFQMVGIPSPEERIADYPHQLSGGMRQRVMIAMALACDPALLIADEPTTALDVTIQAQILYLMRQLQSEHGTAILLITHDLSVVAQSADEVAIMYAGKIVEHAPVKTLFRQPAHPYTRGLFQSLPGMHSRKEPLYTIPGHVPPATQFPPGCRFHTRCPKAMPICARQEPPMQSIGPEHETACWLYGPEGDAS